MAKISNANSSAGTVKSVLVTAAREKMSSKTIACLVTMVFLASAGIQVAFGGIGTSRSATSIDSRTSSRVPSPDNESAVALDNNTVGGGVSDEKAVVSDYNRSISGNSDPPKEGKEMTPGQVSQKLKELGLEPIYAPELHANDTWKAELFQRLDRVRVACGKLCQLNSIEALGKHLVKVEGSHLPMVVVPNVDCPAILDLDEMDAGDTTTPAIPEELLQYFTLGAYRVTKHGKRRDIYLGGESEKKLWSTGNVWKEQEVNDEVQKVANGTSKGSYGYNATIYVRDKLSEIDMKEKSVLVIGSSHPWVEAILLHHGAANITTLEYGEIKSEHPQISTLTPDKFRACYKSGELPKFDGIVSHSSIEHSGLGRYGDALNPWGDIVTVARAWCVTKEGGFMYLGLPTGLDLILSNWHRTYGKIRWPLVAANWKPQDHTDGTELQRHLWRAQENGGWGYIFRKENPGSIRGSSS